MGYSPWDRKESNTTEQITLLLFTLVSHIEHDFVNNIAFRRRCFCFFFFFLPFFNIDIFEETVSAISSKC